MITLVIRDPCKKGVETRIGNSTGKQEVVHLKRDFSMQIK